MKRIPRVAPRWARSLGTKRNQNRHVIPHAFVLLMLMLSAQVAHAQLFDSLDSYPPRWRLDTSDCRARVTEHKNVVSGGIDEGGFESLRFQAGLGSRAIFIYPIEPTYPLNDLVARLAVQSARSGAKIGLRIRFPNLRAADGQRSQSIVVYGTSYSQSGRFQTIGVGQVESQIGIRRAQLRAQYGAEVDLGGAFVDAVVINGYCGPGDTTLHLDNLHIEGMVPLKQSTKQRLDIQPIGPANQPAVAKATLASSSAARQGKLAAFSQKKIVKVLEYQGEPLQWLRSLGFDGILLSQPPTAEILSEAIQTQIAVYAPPPASPDPALERLLDPVVAWYLGGGVALDRSRVTQAAATLATLDAMPERWHRPVIISPVESWSSYASLADGLVLPTAPRRFSISGTQSANEQHRIVNRLTGQTNLAISIDSSSAEPLASMNQSLRETVGAPDVGNFRWQAMYVQVMEALQHSPRAILFRSKRSLVSGTPFSQQRSMALSYINRMIEALSPWISTAERSSSYRVEGARYHCATLAEHPYQILLLTSQQRVGDQVTVASDEPLRIHLPSERMKGVAWRLTDFSTQRLSFQQTSGAAVLELDSPDVVELIVISNDPAIAARLNRSFAPQASRAAADRWQLAREHVQQVVQDWKFAVSAGACRELMPLEVTSNAETLIQRAETHYRSQQWEPTLRLSRLADGNALQISQLLTQGLIAEHLATFDVDRNTGQQTTAADLLPRLFSCPPLDEGRPGLYVTWSPMLSRRGWSQNLIASGGLDRPQVLSEGQWTFAKRQLDRAEANVQWINRGYHSGAGALRLDAHSLTGQSMGGGYEGTISILASPPVELSADQSFRIDVKVRTIGFGDPYQGLLVYDSISGQEMGVLVNDQPGWTTVRLYRHNETKRNLRVMFEVIGDGEAYIDDVKVRVWNPEPLIPLPFQPITP